MSENFCVFKKGNRYTDYYEKVRVQFPRVAYSLSIREHGINVESTPAPLVCEIHEKWAWLREAPGLSLNFLVLNT